MNCIVKRKLVAQNLYNLYTIKTIRSSQTTSEYAIDQIRKYDYENFLCILLLKKTARDIALAIRSFNVEVARVAEQVSQESIGLMRLKFWEDAIDKCYTKNFKDVPKHPVIIELYKAITRSNLSKRHLKNLVLARQQYMNLHSFKTLEEVEKYAELIQCSAFYLTLEGCQVRNVNADHAASHLGKSQCIVQQLRSIPHAKKLNFIPIPESILIKYQLSQEEVYRNIKNQKLIDCVYEIACRAHQHLTTSRSLTAKVPKNGRKSLLPAVPISIYLDRLQKVDYNVLDARLQQKSWKIYPNLFIHSLWNTY